MTEVAEETQAVGAPETGVERTDSARMFRWSGWVHVGEGASECPVTTEDGQTCSEPEHWHAWVRLPNPFQHKEIRERAQAAQARISRRLRDPESDAATILDDEMDELRHGGSKVAVVEALLAKDIGEDYLGAVAKVRELEEFQHMIRDEERLNEIERMSEEARPTEEAEELVRHLTAYGEAVTEGLEAARKPRQEAFEAMPLDELVNLLRQQRVEEIGTEEFLHVYGTWEIVAGTFQPAPVDAETRRPKVRYWREASELLDVAPEIVAALRDTLDDLRVAQQRAVTEGNF